MVPVRDAKSRRMVAKRGVFAVPVRGVDTARQLVLHQEAAPSPPVVSGKAGVTTSEGIRCRWLPVFKVEMVVASLVAAKFPTFHFSEVAPRDEMAVVAQIPTVGPIAADAVKSTRAVV